MIFRILGFILIGLFIHPATAQISGKVFDKNTDNPLSGALIRSQSESIVSDVNGFFQLMEKSSSIEISFLGYQTQSIQLKAM